MESVIISSFSWNTQNSTKSTTHMQMQIDSDSLSKRNNRNVSLNLYAYTDTSTSREYMQMNVRLRQAAVVGRVASKRLDVYAQSAALTHKDRSERRETHIRILYSFRRYPTLHIIITTATGISRESLQLRWQPNLLRAMMKKQQQRRHTQTLQSNARMRQSRNAANVWKRLPTLQCIRRLPNIHLMHIEALDDDGSGVYSIDSSVVLLPQPHGPYTNKNATIRIHYQYASVCVCCVYFQHIQSSRDILILSHLVYQSFPVL